MDPRVVKSFASVLKLDPKEITPDMTADNTPGWDSLGHLRIILELEQNLGVRFSSQDIPTMTSISRIHAVLGSLNGNSLIENTENR